MSIGIQINEYIQESFTEEHNGETMVYYQPVEFWRVISLTGTINIKRREVCEFWAADGHLMINGGKFPGACVLSGSFNANTGCIRLLWDRHPGDHFLCVCYDWQRESDDALDAIHNWKEEGF
jgi:hypothetical protein